MLELNKIYLGDCIEELKEIDNKSIDMICIDPPYFLPATHYNTRKEFKRNFGDLGIMESFIKTLFIELNRILKDTGVMYIFCDGQSYPLFYYHLYPNYKSVRPLIWDKKVSINGYDWRHQHELIIFAKKPNAPIIPTGDGDILRYSAVKVDLRKHPAEKPIDLIKDLILKSSKENDIILDCFAGSGSLGIACKELNRKYILIEKEKEYFDFAKERLDK